MESLTTKSSIELCTMTVDSIETILLSTAHIVGKEFAQTMRFLYWTVENHPFPIRLHGHIVTWINREADEVRNKIAYERMIALSDHLYYVEGDSPLPMQLVIS